MKVKPLQFLRLQETFLELICFGLVSWSLMHLMNEEFKCDNFTLLTRITKSNLNILSLLEGCAREGKDVCSANSIWEKAWRSTLSRFQNHHSGWGTTSVFLISFDKLSSTVNTELQGWFNDSRCSICSPSNDGERG